MKRTICLLMCIAALLSICGCQEDDASFYLRFYYPRQNYGYNTQEQRFYQESAMEELREDIPYRSSQQVIEAYLKGPLNPELINPFPDGTELVALSVEGKTMSMILSDHFADLTGIHLIIACSCLAKTGMVLTNTTQVRIVCQGALLDGQIMIVINADGVIFDDITTIAQPQQE